MKEKRERETENKLKNLINARHGKLANGGKMKLSLSLALSRFQLKRMKRREKFPLTRAFLLL
jgi:hypothetical protein